MSLYLCVFDDDTEIDGIDVGSYSDFKDFRNCVTVELENGEIGFRYHDNFKSGNYSATLIQVLLENNKM
jgi:hypothetical protein